MKRAHVVGIGASLVAALTAVIWVSSRSANQMESDGGARYSSNRARPSRDGDGVASPKPQSVPTQAFTDSAPSESPRNNVGITSTPSWIPPLPFGDRTIPDVAKAFASVPERDGRWVVGQVDPWSVGWEQIYSFNEDELSRATDAFISAFHDRLVSTGREAPEKSDPAVDEWPYFSEWLKESILSYSRLRRREMAVIAAMEAGPPVGWELGEPLLLRPRIAAAADEIRETIRKGIERFLRYK